MEEKSSFDLPENRDVDLELERITFFAETLNFLFAISSSVKKLEERIINLEERVGEKRFEEIIASAGERERVIIMSSCVRAEDVMKRVRSLVKNKEEE